MNKKISALSFLLLCGCSVTFNFGPQSWYEGGNFSSAAPQASEKDSSFDTAKYVAMLIKAGKKNSPANTDLTEKQEKSVLFRLKNLKCAGFEKNVNIKESALIRNALKSVNKNLEFPMNYGKFLAVQYQFAKNENSKAAFSCASNISGFENSLSFSYQLPNAPETGLIFKNDGNNLTLAGVIRGNEKNACSETNCDLLLLQYLITGSNDGVSDILKDFAGIP